MAETKKYVRIKKSKFLRNWYSAYIGKMYIVIGENDIEYITHVGNVLKADAELIVTEKRPAKVGERVLITKPSPMGKQSYKTGDIFIVNHENTPAFGGVRTSDVTGFIGPKEYEVIVNNEVKNEEADGMENVNQTAIDSASTVFEKVGEDYIGSKSRFGDILIGAPYSEAFVKAYANERKDVLVIPQTIEYTAFLRSEDVHASVKEAHKDRSQAHRDEIVEQAKADVEDLFKRDIGYRHDFIVNSEKRTVVALRKSFGEGYVRDRGITKAAPDDCFSVHIGKAIALRRALGLAVPDEYLNAPQPTEVRVGDFISDDRGVHKALVIEDDSWPPFSGDAAIYLKDARKYGYKVIDDSREEVGV
ncbi:hypothetical protein VDJ78_00505 [Bacillus amyloliquefaciens]|uniref:hypothetical protein n=1 Tax=Bacillus amyloliquefaciens TaxID=1390 RepID=UPI002D0AAD46|nr:hypothetical protein [Bacillus amyloliquefaciens]MEB3692774.1 hypothetical protein [Bacillus amyloliquefaciens]